MQSSAKRNDYEDKTPPNEEQRKSPRIRRAWARKDTNWICGEQVEKGRNLFGHAPPQEGWDLLTARPSTVTFRARRRQEPAVQETTVPSVNGAAYQSRLSNSKIRHQPFKDEAVPSISY